MKADNIRVGDRLRLKRDNPYGFGPLVMDVTAITYKDGYKTPWIHTALGAFRPKDFSDHYVNPSRVTASGSDFVTGIL